MGTSRVDLQVPFAEKDEAKRLGARWDSRQRTWYAPEGIEPAPFTWNELLYDHSGHI